MTECIELGGDDGEPVVSFYPAQCVWRLREGYTKHEGAYVFFIPAPFDFDLASIPRPLWGLLACFELGIRGPLIHDWLYRSGGRPTHGRITPTRHYSRAEADRLFLKHMEESGVGRARRTAAYLAVRAFGGTSWRKCP